MRYELVGKKTTYVGKTLWEIVGNLKNFGVGRLVKKSSNSKYPELSFFKIVKVQPIPPPKEEFVNRNVIVWIEEVDRDRKLGVERTMENNDIANFQLIPKEEEEQYLERFRKLKTPVVYVKKYCSWPPLYKTLWEKEIVGEKKYGPIPKLKNVIPDYPGCEVVEKDEEVQESKCSLYKGELTVEEMYKEMVRLKLIIKNNTNA